MFDRKKLVDSFADMVGEADRAWGKFQQERREKELVIKRSDAALARCKDMIESLANALSDAREAPELVKDARIYLSILEGYVEPYTPSKTYPKTDDMMESEPYKTWRNERDKDYKRRSAAERYAEKKERFENEQKEKAAKRAKKTGDAKASRKGRGVKKGAGNKATRNPRKA